MLFRLAVEDAEPDHWVAYVLDLPGCFSPATTLEAAVAQAPQAIQDHFSWLAAHQVLPVLDASAVEVEIVEQFTSFANPNMPDYTVNAFFKDDYRPLRFWDVEAALRLMEWSRRDLLTLLREQQNTVALSPEKLAQVTDILNHIAGAENWYLDRLDVGLARESMPADPWERLAAVRANARKQLIQLIDDQRIAQKSGEMWSARKIVRRLLWHERDHTQHIAQILDRL